MPKKSYIYIGTVTFNGNLTFEKKKKLINSFPDFLSEYLRHTETSEHRLVYTIEYHKVCPGSKEDDYEAPHVHFILYSNYQIPGYAYRAVLKALKDYYGRSQMSLATSAKYIQWKNYIDKDVQKNNEILQFEHKFEILLTKPKKNDFYLEFDDDLISL